MASPLIIDNGLFSAMAARMGRDTEVAYFSTWGNAFPRSRETAPGTGIPNVERVDDPITYMLDGKASMVIVPDLYLNGIERLARQLKLPVFGAGEGTRLETDRWFLKEFLTQHDLPVIHSTEIEGLDRLRTYLRDKKDRFIKVSVFRGDLETHFYHDFESARMWFAKLYQDFGALANKIRFIVEEPIEGAVEVGIDTFYRDGAWLEGFTGIESKDAGYVGKTEFPKFAAPVMEAFGDYFEECGYNSFFSVEMRKVGNYVYVTDATCRIPSPPGGAMMASMRNFTDFMLKDESPQYEGSVICEIVLKSDEARDQWVEVDIPKSVRDRIMLHNYCIIDGRTWVIPHDSKYVEIGSACGWGNSYEEASEMALDAAKAVKADGLRFDDHVLEKAEKDFGRL